MKRAISQIENSNLECLTRRAKANPHVAKQSLVTGVYLLDSITGLKFNEFPLNLLLGFHWTLSKDRSYTSCTVQLMINHRLTIEMVI